MKGFVGGIPIALLAVAAQAMEHTKNGVQGRGVVAHPGGTAMGGPSGADHDGGFIPMTPNVHTHTDVNEYSKDDHSITIKNKDVVRPHAAPMPYGVAMAPGMGPFSKAGGKRSWPHGGTAIGGPSGNDEGQVFDMPITANVYTSVNEESKDDHSIKLKNENIYTPPAHPPMANPPMAYSPGPVSGFREAKQGVPEHYHVPGQAFEKRWGYEEDGTAMGGPSSDDGPSDGPEGFPYPIRAGGTAMGGPSGEDDGINFDNSIHADFHTKVNEYSHDDHSIDIKHTDIYPAAPGFGAPFKRSWGPEKGGWESESGGTAIGGPSGNDGGQEFNMPITVNTVTAVKESYTDDHSIDIKHKDVYTPPAFPEFGGPGPMIPEGGVTPFKRAYSPSSEDRTAGSPGGGTAEGGPSGEDDGINFGDPTDVGVDSEVNEHHEDNHAVKIDDTTVHNPQMPWMPYHEAPAPAPAPAPQPVIKHEEAPACAPVIHNVVHTVTKTATQVVQETATVTQTPMDHIIDHVQTIHETRTVTETSAAHVAGETHTVYVTPSEHVVHVTETVTAPASHVVAATETVYVTPSHAVETIYGSHSHAVETVYVTASQPLQTVYVTPSHAVETVYASPSHVVETVYASPSHLVETPLASSSHVVDTVYASPSHVETPYASPSHVVETVYASPSHVETPYASPSHVVDTVYASPSHVETPYASPSHVVETEGAPWSGTPMVTPVSKVLSSSNIQSVPVSGSPSSSSMAQESSPYQPQGPASSAYSQIPVEVPVASPSSMASMAMPSGADAMQSSKPFASATPSSAVMFTGDAARLSGGIVSAAAAVMGVLAFIL